MLNKKTLNQISRGIRAAEQVRNAYFSSQHRGNGIDGLSGSQDRALLLNDILSVLVNFYPGTARNRLANSLELSSKYLRNYKTLKTYAGTILKQLD